MRMLILCSSTVNSRTYVHISIKYMVVEQFSKLAKNRPLGDPTNPKVDHGPQAGKVQRGTFQRHIKLARPENPAQTNNEADRPLFVEPVVFNQPEDSQKKKFSVQ